MQPETIKIKDYLNLKGIKFWEANGELITKCLFSNCDSDSPDREGHLYFNAETSQYNCKKCGVKGNIFTLVEHLGDTKSDVLLNAHRKARNTSRAATLSPTVVEACNHEMPDRIRKYLNNRGITDELIKEYALGYGEFYGQNWITIPVKDNSGKFYFLKLRRDPANDDTDQDKSKVFPFGKEAQIYGWETLKEAEDKIVICEGEFDRLVLLSKGVVAITSTGGSGTFKKEWMPYFAHIKNLYVCYDLDEAGSNGSKRVLDLFDKNERIDANLFNITLPAEIGEHGDITDYFVKLKGSADDLFDKFSKEYPEKPKIDTSKFRQMDSVELADILGLTIKKDNTNKVITFLTELSAFTEESQMNITFIAPSSTGKSYIPTEIAAIFPQREVMLVGYCSPTAFFHDQGKYMPEKDQYLVDLSRKVLIFLDQPHTQLLEHMRPLLSHDKKEIPIKITDKNQRGGHRTKNILLRGFPAVIFCSASLKLDDQEATRFLILSPEINQEKIREGIGLKIKKEADLQVYKNWLDSDPRRYLLKQRIEAIKEAKIKDIKLENPEMIEKEFFKKRPMLKPKHQRDIGRVIGFAKCIALLNLWWRQKDGTTIVADEKDIKEAFKIWEKISECQELNLPPYLYAFYNEIILIAWKEKNPVIVNGLSPVLLNRKDILKKHLEVYSRVLSIHFLRLQMLPSLESAGLISQEKNPDDQREKLILPLVGLDKIYSEAGGGVNSEIKNNEPV